MIRSSAMPRRRRGIVAVGPWPQLAAFRPVRLETGGRLQLLAIAFGGPVTQLFAEEVQLADKVKEVTAGRAWDLWRKRALGHRGRAAG